MNTYRRTAYWIFDDNYIFPTYLSVASFLKWCKIPVVLLFHGKRIDKAMHFFSSMIAEGWVRMDFIMDDFFKLPIFSFNTAYKEAIRNRELRFYVAACSGPNDIVYCFDSDIVFTESVTDLLKIKFDYLPSIYGCVERQHTRENKLFFERSIIHTNKQHVYPEIQTEMYDQVFMEDTSLWLEMPQFNNGVLVFYNAKELASCWKEVHNKSLLNPKVNPGEDQVTLTAAIYKTGIKRIELPSLFNSMGQIFGDYAVFHATGGQWKGEIINAVSNNRYVQQNLSSCAKVYKQFIQSLDCDIIEELQLTPTSPYLYHSIDGFFFFKSAYDYIYETLPLYGVFVEIGTYKGKSICYLAEREKCEKKDVKIFSVDNYSNIGYPQSIDYQDAINIFLELGLSDYVTLINSDSLQASKMFDDKSIDCVYIDSDQRYESVLSDLECWYGKVRDGGILAGDDYTRLLSVRKAVDDFCKEKQITFKILEQSYIIEV